MPARPNHQRHGVIGHAAVGHGEQHLVALRRQIKGDFTHTGPGETEFAQRHQLGHLTGGAGFGAKTLRALAGGGRQLIVAPHQLEAGAHLQGHGAGRQPLAAQVAVGQVGPHPVDGAGQAALQAQGVAIGQLAVLGAGDPLIEQALQHAAQRHPGAVGLHIGYDEALAHGLIAGSDVILVPSRFEPCGLTQLYGLRYGCIPIVGHTGGLADHIIDANGAAVAAKVATGVEFTPGTSEGLIGALRRTFHLFANLKTGTTMQKTAMKSDVSWAASARQYADLYQTLLSRVQ